MRGLQPGELALFAAAYVIVGDVKSLIVTNHHNAFPNMGSLFSKTKQTKSSSHFNELDVLGHAFVCSPLAPLDLGIKVMLLFLR